MIELSLNCTAEWTILWRCTTICEEAVKLFLEDKIGFLDIGRLVEAVVDSDSFGGDYTLADVYECDRMARAFVQAHL